LAQFAKEQWRRGSAFPGGLWGRSIWVVRGFATCAGRHFCMHGNYVSRNFICVNAMQQKAAASEHNTNTQKDGKMSYKLGPTEICPSNKKKTPLPRPSYL